MSIKEVRRRNVASRVFKKAWEIYRRYGGKWVYSFSCCLKLAWKIVRRISGFIFTNVKGVNYTNTDTGVSRQKIIQAMFKYPSFMISLYFERENDNKYDKNAVKIFVKVGDKGSCQVGYLAKELADTKLKSY